MRRSVLLVGRNLSMLMGSHVLNRLLYVALVGVIGRRLGAEILGGYAIAVAVGVRADSWTTPVPILIVDVFDAEPL